MAMASQRDGRGTLRGTSSGGPTYTGVAPSPKARQMREGYGLFECDDVQGNPAWNRGGTRDVFGSRYQNFPHSGTELAV